MPERQQLEILRREQKTQRDALASIEDKIQQAERQNTKLSSEIDRLAERDETVSTAGTIALTPQMDTKVQELNEERERIKSQLDQAAAERSRIK